MGNGSAKTDRRIPNAPQVVRGYATFACCCRDRRTTVVEEKRRTPSEEVTKAEEEIMFLIVYKRTRPRSCCGMLCFGLSYFCCDLCPMVCCPPCPAAIIHKLAFRPPERPTYDLIRFGGETEYRMRLRSAATEFARLRYRRGQAYLPQLRCFYVHCKNAPRIACVFAHSFTPITEATPLTLLYSHNNGIDLGLCAGHVVLLSRRFRVNVFAYDYSGYGRSSGQCSEDDLYRSAEAAYDFVTQDLDVPPEQLVAVGTSLGTAAAIHLASSNRPLKGVILQGGFLSALRTVCPNRSRTCQMDRFVNMDKIERVECPTLVVHGRKDKLFSVAHAVKLRDLCPGAKRIEPLLIDDCGHIDFDDFPAYWQRLHKFLHIELTQVGVDRPCCTYHPAEVVIRQSLKIQASMRNRAARSPSGTTVAQQSVQ